MDFFAFTHPALKSEKIFLKISVPLNLELKILSEWGGSDC